VGDKPILIGECGIPMDINQKRAFLTGDYAHHTNFLDAVLRAMENNLVHFTLWNYNPHNDNFYGDYWNGEDFSIFTKSVAPSIAPSVVPSVVQSANQSIAPSKRSSVHTRPTSKQGKISIQTQPNTFEPNLDELLGSPDSVFDLVEGCFDDEDDEHVGGRALDAVIRPYAAKTAGTPLSTLFLLEQTAFELVFITPKQGDHGMSRQSRTTEIFVPSFHYKRFSKVHVVVSDGVWEYDEENQTVYWVIDPTRESPRPDSPDSIPWIAARKSLATTALMETHNFHTIQITPPPKPKPSKSRICAPTTLCNIL
jgi:hypothetical protein